MTGVQTCALPIFELHGNESVWPEHKLQELLSSVKKQSIEEYKNEILGSMQAATPSTNNESFSTAVSDLKNSLTTKFDQMVSKLEDIHRVEEQILRNSMV